MRTSCLIVLAMMLGALAAHAGGQAVFIVLDTDETYTVPAGKTFVVEYSVNVSGLYGCAYVAPPGKPDDFVQVRAFFSTSTSSSFAPVSTRTTMKFPAGTVFKGYGYYLGLLVDSDELYVHNGRIDEFGEEGERLTIHASAPPAQASQVRVESTDDLASGNWEEDLSARVTRMSKGSTDFDVTMQKPAAGNRFYRTRFIPKK